MEQSEQTSDLFAALAKAQGAFPDIAKDKKASIKPKDPTKPSFEYMYADLATILRHIRPALKENGLSFSQDTIFPGPKLMAKVTQINHISGQWLRITGAPIPYGDEPRGVGSSDTYARRYSLSSAFGIATEEDDDALQAARDAARQESQNRRAAEPRTRTYGNQRAKETEGLADPGSYIFPVDEKYKGRPIREVPEGYLRNFIMGSNFDKEDVREATAAYLSTLADPEDLAFLCYMVDVVLIDGIDPDTFHARLDQEKERNFNKVRAGWLDAAKESVLTARVDEQVIAQRRVEFDNLPHKVRHPKKTESENEAAPAAEGGE